MLGPVARHDNQLGHASPSSVSCRRRYVARCAPNQALLSAALGTKGEYVMGLSQQQLNAGIDALAERDANFARALGNAGRSEEHTSELQSLMRISYAVFCFKHKNN